MIRGSITRIVRLARACRTGACLAGIGATMVPMTATGSAVAADLGVCIDKASPTVAADQKLAEAVATAEHARLVLFQFDGSGDGDDGFDVKEFQGLLANHCDLVLGFPSEAANAALPAGLVATAPYGSTGFVLVLASGLDATGLDDLPDGTEVAVTYGTAPNLFLVQHPKLKPDLHPTDTETIQTIMSGSVKAAMLWHPTFASTFGHGAASGGAGVTSPSRFSVHPLTDRHATWNLVALRTQAHPAEATQFEAAIAALEHSGELSHIMQPYGIEAPIPVAASPPDKHADAGPQPQHLADGFDARDVKRVATGGDQPPAALYTAAQAKQGEQKFADNCAQCHGDHLEGMAGPALKGPNFASEKAAFKVGDIFTIVAENMPATQPGSLEHDDYVQIMAFLMQQNGYPAGPAELKFDTAKTSTVPFVYRAN